MAVEYSSGQIRVSGLTENGASFEDMITNLKKIELQTATKLNQWKLDWQQRQEAFRQVRSQLESLRTVCNEINSVEKFMVKAASSSVSTVASAVANSNAVSGGADMVEVKQLAKAAIWSADTGASKLSDLVNTGSTDQYFSYEYAGQTRTITVPPGTTLENFRNLINNDAKNLGVKINLIQSGGQYVMQFKGNDVGSKNDLKVLTNTVDMFSGGTYPPYGTKFATEFKNTTGVVNGSSTSPLNFTYTHGGTDHTVAIPPGATLQDFVDTINSDSGTPAGVSASLVSEPNGTYSVRFESTDGGAVTPKIKTIGKLKLGEQTTEDNGDPTGSPWHVQHSEDAMVKVNGWPAGDGNWLVKESNTVDDIIEGVSVTLKDVGTTVITVATDTEQIKENVIKFIDAVNEFRTLINDTTKIDEEKNTVAPEYATSLYEMQSGSILTGNYGVQLLASQIKQATAGMPLGFKSMLSGSSTGDIYTSLSQLGIKTMAEGSGGPDFGLLILNDDERLPTLDKVLAENPMAVAEFFAAKDLGVSDSSDFSYDSMVSTITQPGSYEVKYTMVDGEVSAVPPPTINGKEAKIQGDGAIFLPREDPKSSDPTVASALTEGLADYEYDVNIINTASKSKTTIATGLTDRAASINEDTDDLTFDYDFNGKSFSMDVPPGATLDQLVRSINRAPNNPGLSARVETTDDVPPQYNLVMEAKDTGNNSPINVTVTGNDTVLDDTPPTAVAGEDARYQIRKTGSSTWGATKTSKTNTFTIAPGLSVTARGVGETTIKALHHNDADGITIRPDNKTDGAYTGTVRIKQGKVNEMLRLLNGRSGKTEEGMLGSKGALKILENNYDDIIAGINSKLEREDERLIKWERTIRARFARLEGILKQYEGLQATVESQVKQLSSSSK